ncbi:aspartoacylase [Synechococcus sp. M16CYN]|uniref:aspartoacylase n=1 Tax=Synechococcus sp. M16CYN TaxID=3103139 RepID=UPI0032482439
MATCDVLIVAGTHGNEINAPWLLEQWAHQPDLIDKAGLSVRPLIGNPQARASMRRYIDRDLNRSFKTDLLQQQGGDVEMQRAQYLLASHGPSGIEPCAIALDLHSTTAAMGSALILYGRRAADLALAALVQAALGLPVYLHEADSSQTGFLVECWPCGLVIEVGPVPQGVLEARIVRQTRLALETCLAALAGVRSGVARLPKHLVVHRHLGSCDLPRAEADQPQALLHHRLQGKNWVPLTRASPVFETADGMSMQSKILEDQQIPVFINEAAYAEKRIAFSLTNREVWAVKTNWLQRLAEILK